MGDQGAQGLFSPFLRQARMKAAQKWLTGRVLDVGCGSGALAAFIDANRYVGFDRDESCIETARQLFPQHRFMASFPDAGGFDTVVALALIEHLPNPLEELRRWAAALEPGGKIVLTTPHKAFRAIHDLGARIGIFSADAADEHEEMFDGGDLAALAQGGGLRLAEYRRFLFGANQLCVMSK
ncbi:MAG TPA: class I SAM-dependent methyltransferase [Rhizobiaceae bacterium]|nr:class I SAM-dependent methyltransferase [Rhizobiaceae bacterium]